MESISLVDSEQAKQELMDSLGEAGKLLEEVTFRKLPEIIEFSLLRIDPLSEDEIHQIKDLAGVNQLVYGRETQDQIQVFFNIANFVGIFLIVLFLVSVVFIIRNSIQIAVRSRLKEIEILRTLGATTHFISWPYIWEGIFISIFSFLFSICGIFFVYHFIIAGITFNEATYGIKDKVQFFSPLFLLVTLLLIMIMGVISSHSATNKILTHLDS